MQEGVSVYKKYKLFYTWMDSLVAIYENILEHWIGQTEVNVGQRKMLFQSAVSSANIHTKL